MRTVSTKKELLQAIEDGETRIDVTDKKLFLSCKLAAKYCNHKHPKTAILAKVGEEVEDSMPRSSYYGEERLSLEAAGLVITIIIATTAIAIVALLRKKRTGKVKFCFPGNGCVETSWNDK